MATLHLLSEFLADISPYSYCMTVLFFVYVTPLSGFY